MAALDGITPVIKKPQVDNVTNTSGKKQHHREVKSSDSSTSTVNKCIVILGNSLIKHGNKISKKLQNGKVLIRRFSGSKLRFMNDHNA